MQKKSTIPSLIKWTGSKRSLAHQISLLVPVHNRYLEPFLGGGAVLFCLAKPGSIASDVYKPLMQIWKSVQDNPDQVAELYKNDWDLLQKDFPNHFYNVRKRFNEHPNGQDLLFLSRTCTNGIIRFNSKGEFNNSLHVTRKGMNPDRFLDITKKWSMKLQGVQLLTSDYREVLETAKKGDFVYLDPPYMNSNNRYIQNLALPEFLESLEKLNYRGVKWALSFDGSRGDFAYNFDMPRELYVDRFFLKNGNSAVKKVLSSTVEDVTESFIVNYRV